MGQNGAAALAGWQGSELNIAALEAEGISGQRSRNLPPALRWGSILPNVPAPSSLELLEHLSTCLTFDFGRSAHVPMAKCMLLPPLQD